MDMSSLGTRVQMPRGSSGAAFIEGRSTVFKAGDGRVVSQGVWLRDARQSVSSHFPVIHEINRDGYLMERLTEMPRSVVDPRLLVGQLVDMLQPVWSSSRLPVVAVDVDRHKDKVLGLLNWAHPALRSKFKRIMGHVRWDRLRVGPVHGDPTFDNLMLRTFTGELVLIDSIPQTPEVPSLVCVDRGKIMTSVLGFEQMRYGDNRMIAGTNEESFLAHSCENANEVLAMYYWCAVHFLRAIPYMPTDEVKKEIQNAFTRLVCDL